MISSLSRFLRQEAVRVVLVATQKPRSATRLITLILTGFLALTVGLLALTPLAKLPELTSGDKVQHLVAFAVLMFPAAALIPKDLVWLLPLALLYGGLIEVVQPYVNRCCVRGDFWADSVGAILGAGIGFATCLVVRRLKERGARGDRDGPESHHGSDTIDMPGEQGNCDPETTSRDCSREGRGSTKKNKEVKTGKQFLFRRMQEESKQSPSKQQSDKIQVGLPPPHRFQGLANWVYVQRKHYRDGKLSEEQTRRLEDLGIIWRHEDAKWEMQSLELRKYNETHGDCAVPVKWIPNPILASWVSDQRNLFTKGKLSEERTRRLQELAFAFDIEKIRWEEMLRQLNEFKEQKGHANVPEHIEIYEKKRQRSDPGTSAKSGLRKL